MKLLATHHIAVLTTRFEEMERFYTETLGLPVTLRWDDVGILFIDVGSTTIELIRKDADERDRNVRAGFDHLALKVESVDEAYASLSALGVAFTGPPRDFKHVRIVFFTDPDGNILELVEER